MDIWITDMEAQLLNEDIGKVDSIVLSNNRTSLVRHVTKIVVCLGSLGCPEPSEETWFNTRRYYNQTRTY